ncbi:MAG TPA: SLC13 family permease [Anaerolineae bacterium]|nr:SLC13 family permease [Anaerolineae bacterium]
MRQYGLYGVAVLGVANLVAGAVEWHVAPPGLAESNSPAFVVSLGIFLITLAGIVVPWVHETVAALAGAVLLWLVHYVGGTLWPALRLAGFQESMAYVDWNVIFLVLGMMIFMAMLSETGVLRWLALHAFRLARGNAWLLGLILILLTAITSSLLNNATAMLLLVPLSIQIAQIVGLRPAAYVLPEVFAANIGGAATIIGDPPSTLVASHLGMGFFEYAAGAAPVTLVSLVLLLGLAALLYRRDLAGARDLASPSLVAELEAEAQIRDMTLLRRSALVGLVTLALFFAGDRFSLPPSVIALTGATWLMIWVRPDMRRMLREVDWTTLVFFIGIFVLVGGLEKGGVVTRLADLISNLAGDSLVLATTLMVWVSGLVSGVVDNIPYTIAALPIADQLTATIASADGSSVLYWALVFGADLGGSATPIGSAANIVAVGLLAQAGYRVSFARFLRDGLVVTVGTLVVATLWLLICY